MATVLVVDDRAVSRDLVRTLLGYQGYDVLEADDGETALKLVGEHDPDLMIIDVVMPDMNGYELVRRVRSNPATAGLPVIFYTANYVEEEIGPLASSLGVDTVVHKTGDLTELLAAVHGALLGTSAPPVPVADVDFGREQLRLLNAKLVEKVRELEEKERLHTLVDAAVAIVGDLGLRETLNRIAGTARALVKARYAALRYAAQPDGPIEFAEDGELPAEGAAVLDIPIGAGRLPCGVLRVHGARGGAFTPGDEALLIALGSAADSAIRNAYLYDAAVQAQQATAELVQRGVLRDRERIARDLHDVVVQRIFTAGLTLNGLRNRLSPADAARLDDVIAQLDETIDDVRSTIYELRTASAGPGSMCAQLRAVTEEAAGPLGFAAKLAVDGAADDVPEHVRPDLLATLREALANAARHADASKVEVRLSVGDGTLTLRVADDGPGLPARRQESGLANLRSRALELGGTMTNTNLPTGGHVLDWRVPI